MNTAQEIVDFLLPRPHWSQKDFRGKLLPEVQAYRAFCLQWVENKLLETKERYAAKGMEEAE